MSTAATACSRDGAVCSGGWTSYCVRRMAVVFVAIVLIGVSCSSGPPRQIEGGDGWRFLSDGGGPLRPRGNYLVANDRDLAARLSESFFDDAVDVDFGQEAVLWLDHIDGNTDCSTSVVSSVEVVGDTVKITLESWSAQEFCEAIGVFSTRLLAIDREVLPADPFFVQFNDGEPEPVQLIEPDS